MKRNCSWLRLTVAVAGGVWISFAGAAALAQPAPTFESTCANLRKSMATLDLKDDPLITIDVVGPLTGVKFDGTLAYLSMCRAPDLRVVCITYSTNGRQAGDTVVLTGAIHPQGPDLLVLDPCLHHIPK